MIPGGPGCDPEMTGVVPGDDLHLAAVGRAVGARRGGHTGEVATPGLAVDRRTDGRAVWARLAAFDRARPHVGDAAVAAGLAAVTSPWLILHTDHRLVLWLFQVALTAPLMWRRRHPVAVFAVLSAVAVAQLVLADPLLADVSLLVAVFGVALERPPRAALGAGVLVEVLVVVASARGSLAESWIRSVVGLTGLLAAALLLGAVLRVRRAHLAELTERAARLEIERDQQARIAAAAERTRIAREMHDVIAHSLAVIVTLADAAGAKLAKEPERAAGAVQSIADTAREALGDTRRLLGVLRENTAGADLTPQPGLDQLDALINQLCATGLRATLTRTGDPFPLAPATELTVYRLLQEAGTNTLKHGHDATRFDACLRYSYPTLTIDAVDDGTATGPTSGRAGHGIAGMRERVALYGGTVHAGPAPAGGWRMTAVLSAAGADGR